MPNVIPTAHQDQVADLYVQQSDRVRRLVARALRTEDLHLADDLAQDVWLTYWQYVLRGNVIDAPAGLLATMARRRVIDHYRTAWARRVGVSDFSDYDLARKLPAAPAAEDVAVERITAAAILADYPTPLGVDGLADWTGADFDSYTVLASIGHAAPAAAVSRARAARPVRRAVRTALRSVRRVVQTGAAA